MEPQQCHALSPEGAKCHSLRSKPDNPLCWKHRREHNKMYGNYKRTEKEYRAIDGQHDKMSKEQLHTKIELGTRALKLRSDVNRRFFNMDANNRGHVQWILGIESEIEALKTHERTFAAEARKDEAMVTSDIDSDHALSGKLVYRSLISPEVPWSELAHLPAESPARVLKSCFEELLNMSIKGLYEVAPYLDDSKLANDDQIQNKTPSDEKFAAIMRYVLRELIVWQADADTLALAKKTDSVDSFLRLCGPVVLKEYRIFLELLGRVDTLHFLRDAICDYLLPENVESVKILGARIALDDKHRSMRVEGWDILYSLFWDFVESYELEQYCVRAEDLILIKRLIAFGRYSQQESTEGPEWISKEHDVGYDSPLAILQGFVGVCCGYVGASAEPAVLDNERQYRCYLVGRMAKSEKLAPALMAELTKRLWRYIVFVHDAEDGGSCLEGKILYQTNDEDKNPWLLRTRRPADQVQKPKDQQWTLLMTFDDVKADLRVMRNLKDRNMQTDYFEFFIMYRHHNLEFRILDEVAEILLQLAGNPSPQDVAKSAIESSVPLEEQAALLQALKFEVPPDFDVEVTDLQYEGNRVRTWDICAKQPSFYATLPKMTRTRYNDRLLMKMIAELERTGVITPVEIYEPAQALPTFVKGTDGNVDLYFNYRADAVDMSAFRDSILYLPPVSLRDFAMRYKSTHPDAVFAKGKLNTHYCAWPLSTSISPKYSEMNFCTIQGHLFKWKLVPFDAPLAAETWQHCVHQKINMKLSFAFIQATTIVICAENKEMAGNNYTLLGATAQAENWKVSIPAPSTWTTSFENLDLDTPWRGIAPAGTSFTLI